MQEMEDSVRNSLLFKAKMDEAREYLNNNKIKIKSNFCSHKSKII